MADVSWLYRVPPGARYDPIGPGDGPRNIRGGGRGAFPGAGGGGGFRGGGPPNPFGGFGDGDFILMRGRGWMGMCMIMTTAFAWDVYWGWGMAWV